MYYESNYLSHHGVKGMKWGVRKEPERKGKKVEIDKVDKKKRRELELVAYDSGAILNKYKKTQKRVNKRYEKAISEDPKLELDKTKKVSFTKHLLDSTVEANEKENKENIDKLKTHVDKMVSKYGAVSVKDVSVKTTKSGAEWVKSNYAAFANINSMYTVGSASVTDTKGNKLGSVYVPSKMRWYYY